MSLEIFVLLFKIPLDLHLFLRFSKSNKALYNIFICGLFGEMSVWSRRNPETLAPVIFITVLVRVKYEADLYRLHLAADSEGL